MSDPVTFTTRALGLDRPVPAYADPHSRALGRLQHDLREAELEVARWQAAMDEAHEGKLAAEKRVRQYRRELAQKEGERGR